MRHDGRCAICGAELGSGIRCLLHGTPEQAEASQTDATGLVAQRMTSIEMSGHQVPALAGDVSAIEKALNEFDVRTGCETALAKAARAELAALRATVEAQAKQIGLLREALRKTWRVLDIAEPNDPATEEAFAVLSSAPSTAAVVPLEERPLLVAWYVIALARQMASEFGIEMGEAFERERAINAYRKSPHFYNATRIIEEALSAAIRDAERETT